MALSIQVWSMALSIQVGTWPAQSMGQLLLTMHGRMHKHARIPRRATHASAQHHNLIYTCFRITTQQL
jgi:hypothetical protein